MAQYKRLLQIGSRGDDVKAVQTALHCEPDGIYGKHTAEAVRQFQKTHGLEVDGIVGKHTWNALFPSSSAATSVAPDVIYAPLKECITKANRTIKYLAIHYTAGTTSKAGTAKSMKASWERNKNASADFGVDDRDMVQFNPNPSQYYCWAVGGSKKAGATLHGIATNANTINIEICSSLKSGYDRNAPNHDGWYFTEATLNNAVKLAKILMAKYNIPIERVIRHYDVTGKLCPGLVGWNNGYIYTKDGKMTTERNTSAKWLAFKKRLTDG